MAPTVRIKKQRFVYLDTAAATEVDSAVFAAMKPYFTSKYANPSALYTPAIEVRATIENARALAASFLHAQSDTIIFTSGGTESANAAILGVARGGKRRKEGKHIITSVIEHHSVLEPIRRLEKEGWQVTRLPVDGDGNIKVSNFKKALRPETALVSIMYANNEIGTILPIADIGREILKWRKDKKTPYPYFHVDACQAAGYLDLNVDKLHVDLMSFNGSKIYGPKGIGVLYKRRGTQIEPMLHGGGQEMGYRSGTENVPGIVGLAKSLELIQKNREKEWNRVATLRDYFWEEIQKRIANVTLNGPRLHAVTPGMHKLNKRSEARTRLPNNLNIIFSGVDAEELIIYLDACGIACSSGSACTTDSDEVSHVLQAIGRTSEQTISAIRFTLGRTTTKKDIDYVLRMLPRIVRQCRKTKKIS